MQTVDEKVMREVARKVLTGLRDDNTAEVEPLSTDEVSALEKLADQPARYSES